MKLLNYHQSDIDLVKACLKNDKAAQKWLFDTYAKQMLGLCYRYVNDYDLAHDLMQDSFIKVFEKLETYRAESPLKSWIRKIMVNTCLGHIRKQKNLQLTNLDSAEHILTNENVFSDFLEFDMVMNAISKLPMNMRTVLNLFAIEGYSYTEIATELGLEESSVRAHVSRARKQLIESIGIKTGMRVS